MTSAATYQHGPDSQRHPGVPQGDVTRLSHVSTIFPDTRREYWVYVPQQYDPATPAAVMVFQDGHAYVSEDGRFRVPIVFDNLIHAGTMPVTIGIFINPGHVGDELPTSTGGASNRSFEYDSLSDQYARFLLDEILPEVGAQWKLSDDPEQRAICGLSSGGDLRVYRGVGAPRRLPQSAFAHRLVHRHSRRSRLPLAHPQGSTAAAAGLPARWRGRSGQPVRATGGSRTSRWSPRSSIAATTIHLRPAPARTMANTAARSCPNSLRWLWRLENASDWATCTR